MRIAWKYHIGWLLGSTICILIGTFILYIMGDREHLDNTKFNGQVYHLARRIDNRNWADYLLCRCDDAGNLCRCQDVYATSPPRPAVLDVNDTTNVLSVRLTGDRFLPDKIVYTHDASGTQWCENEYFCHALNE